MNTDHASACSPKAGSQPYLAAMWQSEARLQVQDILLEVGEFEWPQPVATAACTDQYQLKNWHNCAASVFAT